MISFRVKPSMSIFEWAEYIGLNYWYVAGIGQGFPSDYELGLSAYPMFQQPWQVSDRLSRLDVAEALDRAERRLETVLGYYPAERFIVEQDGQYPQPSQIGRWTSMVDSQGRWKAVKANTGRIISMGVESLTEQETDVFVTYSDEDGDGVDDTFTVVATVDIGTTADEVAVYFSSNDRFDEALTYYEVRPVRVSIDGTTATITGHKTLCVAPENYKGFRSDPLNLNDSIFVSLLDVYRRTVDTTDQGTLVWENLPPQWYDYAFRYSPSDDYCYPCEVEVKAACFQIRNRELGYIAPAPAAYQSDSSRFLLSLPDEYKSPDRYYMNYRAGQQRQGGRVPEPYRSWIAKLATAYLKNTRGGGKDDDRALRYYQSLPVNETSGNLQVSQEVLEGANKMFGSQFRGAVEVFQDLRYQERWGAWHL